MSSIPREKITRQYSPVNEREMKNVIKPICPLNIWNAFTDEKTTAANETRLLSEIEYCRRFDPPVSSRFIITVCEEWSAFPLEMMPFTYINGIRDKHMQYRNYSADMAVR